MRRLALDVSVDAKVHDLRVSQEENMWWGIGFGGAMLYLIVAFTLGLMTLRNRHGWLFFFGIFFPVLWIFGAFMRPPEMTQPA
jgi:hypothetical protein